MTACVPCRFHIRTRSEEHTSELQSRLHIVCRLLLEKKKTEQSIYTVTTLPPTAEKSRLTGEKVPIQSFDYSNIRRFSSRPIFVVLSKIHENSIHAF